MVYLNVHLHEKPCLHIYFCHVWRIGVQRESHIDKFHGRSVCVGRNYSINSICNSVELLLQHGAWSCVTWLIGFSFCYSFLWNFSFARLLYVNFGKICGKIMKEWSRREQQEHVYLEHSLKSFPYISWSVWNVVCFDFIWW